MPRAYHIAFRDNGDIMVPASRDGEILLFLSCEEAQAATGALGVASYVPIEQVYVYAQRHGLTVPQNGHRQLSLFERGDAMDIGGRGE